VRFRVESLFHQIDVLKFKPTTAAKKDNFLNFISKYLRKFGTFNKILVLVTITVTWVMICQNIDQTGSWLFGISPLKLENDLVIG
jgi:hypothetical protein